MGFLSLVGLVVVCAVCGGVIAGAATMAGNLYAKRLFRLRDEAQDLSDRINASLGRDRARDDYMYLRFRCMVCKRTRRGRMPRRQWRRLKREYENRIGVWKTRLSETEQA